MEYVRKEAVNTNEMYIIAHTHFTRVIYHTETSEVRIP